MQIDYDGDEAGGRILSWFKLQLKAIGTCLEAGLPEAALIIIYSGIDSFGLLAAPSSVRNASRATYMQWCDNYILTRLQSVEGILISADDMYAASVAVFSTPQHHFQALNVVVQPVKFGINSKIKRAST